MLYQLFDNKNSLRKEKLKKSPATKVKKTKDLTSMNVTDLKNIAKKNGIANISKMKKYNSNTTLF